jgi:hypothetical protein
MSKPVREKGAHIVTYAKEHSVAVLRRFLAEPQGRLLVVSACSASKRYKIDNPLTEFDLDDADRRQKAEAGMRNYHLAAAEMYTGSGHRYVREAIRLLRQDRPCVSHYILSAGYGLLRETDVIVPYEVTFSGLTKWKIRERSERLRLRECLIKVAQDYDQAILVLGREYFVAIGLPLPIAQLPPALAYIAPSLKEQLGIGIQTVLIGEAERRDMHVYSSSAKEKRFEFDVRKAMGLNER